MRPRAASARQISIGTFDNFNLVVAGVKGSIAGAVGLIYETLTTPSQDEVSTEYGVLAEVSEPSRRFFLRDLSPAHAGEMARRQAGDAGRRDLLARFVQEIHPRYSAYYRHVVKAEKTGERDVKFTFDAPGNRELPQIVGQLTVLPKHWWEGTDSEGRKRDISATTLEKPLGCGAYRIKEFVAGRSIVLERVKDYWGRDLNVNIGRNNFDELRFEYFRDSTVALEAFKGDQVDWRTENSAKNWATAYDFPAVTEKRVLKEEFPNRSSGSMQAFALNMRRDKFSRSAGAPRVQFRLRFRGNEQADFLRSVQAHQQLFRRHRTRFQRSAAGPGTGNPRNRARQVPAEVFTTPYTNPVGGNPEAVRDNLREALRLLKEAGYEVRDRKLVDVRPERSSRSNCWLRIRASNA